MFFSYCYPNCFLTSFCNAFLSTSVCRIFEGGPRNLRIMKTKRKRFPLRISSFFCPNLGKDQRKRSSLRFSPFFYPNLGEDLKKRSSLRFSPFFYPNLGEDLKRGLHSDLTRFSAHFR